MDTEVKVAVTPPTTVVAVIVMADVTGVKVDVGLVCFVSFFVSDGVVFVSSGVGVEDVDGGVVTGVETTEEVVLMGGGGLEDTTGVVVADREGVGEGVALAEGVGLAVGVVVGVLTVGVTVGVLVDESEASVSCLCMIAFNPSSNQPAEVNEEMASNASKVFVGRDNILMVCVFWMEGGGKEMLIWWCCPFGVVFEMWCFKSENGLFVSDEAAYYTIDCSRAIESWD